MTAKIVVMAGTYVYAFVKLKDEAKCRFSPMFLVFSTKWGKRVKKKWEPKEDSVLITAMTLSAL